MCAAEQRLPVVFLMGPTAGGKTALAVSLCQHLPFDIVSVDSAMVYKTMDIGTAKPGPEILAAAPHRLIDIRDPVAAYSAGDFRADALREIHQIHTNGRIPLLVGGTGLYFRALEHGIAALPAADAEIRRQLTAEAALEGWPRLHERLQQLDPAAAQRIHPHDPQRIQRALEVYQLSGKPLSAFFSKQADLALPYRIIKIIVAPRQRAWLHERIQRRFAEMMEFGLVDEVKVLYARADLSRESPSMRIVGYRQVWQYLEGRLKWEDMPGKAVVATRQLAKRQLTWLRAEPDANWFDTQQDDFVAKVLRFLQEDPILSSRV